MKNIFFITITLNLFFCAHSFADTPSNKSSSDQKHTEHHVEHLKIEGCCKVCRTDKSKPCGNTCIPLGEECGKGQGCACTQDGKHKLEEKSIWIAPK